MSFARGHRRQKNWQISRNFLHFSLAVGPGIQQAIIGTQKPLHFLQTSHVFKTHLQQLPVQEMLVASNDSRAERHACLRADLLDTMQLFVLETSLAQNMPMFWLEAMQGFDVTDQSRQCDVARFRPPTRFGFSVLPRF
jgi:hypothetical protein